jgi:hypothetical protein
MDEDEESGGIIPVNAAWRFALRSALQFARRFSTFAANHFPTAHTDELVLR